MPATIVRNDERERERVCVDNALLDRCGFVDCSLTWVNLRGCPRASSFRNIARVVTEPNESIHRERSSKEIVGVRVETYSL